MQTVATKSHVSSQTPVPVQHGVKQGVTHSSPTIHTLPVSSAVLPKAMCACGGGCPKCAEENHAETIQTKLTISAPGDQYEQEADRVAEQVMRMPQPDNAHFAEPKERSGLRVSSYSSIGASQSHDVPAAVHEVLRSPGVPLDSSTRSFMEPRFGHDFTQVRVHTDEKAALSASVVNALAYTVGRDIVFGANQFAPETVSGRGLLAHELTHVAQQSGQVQPQIQRTFECGDLLANPSIASLVGGSAVHAAIAAHFRANVPGATHVMIPGASAGPLRSAGLCGGETPVTPPQLIGGAAGAGFPDLARITTGGILQVAEIKPAAIPCLIDGEEQLLRYINQGNATDPAQVAWRASLGVTVVAPMLTTAYQPPPLSLGVAQVETAWCSPGLLAYTVRTGPPPILVRVPSEQRSQERQRYRVSAGDRIPVTVAVGAGVVVATVVARSALWRHFWRAVAQRFALRGAIALGLAAADGPLPFGEIIDLGIGVATAIEIFIVWNDLWRAADQIAAAESA